jgi:hypothetical protein
MDFILHGLNLSVPDLLFSPSSQIPIFRQITDNFWQQHGITPSPQKFQWSGFDWAEGSSKSGPDQVKPVVYPTELD